VVGNVNHDRIQPDPIFREGVVKRIRVIIADMLCCSFSKNKGVSAVGINCHTPSSTLLRPLSALLPLEIRPVLPYLRHRIVKRSGKWREEVIFGSICMSAGCCEVVCEGQQIFRVCFRGEMVV
jgi:hypothetical protein